MSDCLFCKIIAGDIPAHKVYETDHVLAFLDIGPVSPGHTLVIPKAHAGDLGAGSEAEAVELMRVVYFLGPKIMQALGAQGYNLGMNHGEVAGQDVMHTHLHIMPRKAGEGRAFIKQHPSQDELARVANLIKTSLSS